MSDENPNDRFALPPVQPTPWWVFLGGILLSLGGFLWLAATRSRPSVHATTIPLLAQAGSIQVVVILAIVAIVILKRGRRLIDVAFVSLCVVGAVVGNLAVKAVLTDSLDRGWDRELGFALGFPSGIAMTTFALAAAFVVVAWRTEWRWEITFVGGAGTVLVAYVLVGTHANTPGEVLAAWTLSTAWTVALGLLRATVLNRHTQGYA